MYVEKKLRKRRAWPREVTGSQSMGVHLDRFTGVGALQVERRL